MEIGTVQCQQGGIYKVKPLGAYAMIDDGELDWKIVCIRTDDPKADVLNDIEDVERGARSSKTTLQISWMKHDRKKAGMQSLHDRYAGYKARLWPPGRQPNVIMVC